MSSDARKSFSIHGMRRLLGLGVLCLAAAAIPAHAVSFPAGDLDRYVFVANETSPEIAVVDTRTDELAASVALPGIPDQFVLSERLGLLAASHRGQRAVSLTDLSGGRPQVSLPLPFELEQIQLDPSGERLAVTSGAAGAVALLSLSEQRETWSVAGLPAPSYMIFDREGERLFVSSAAESGVTVLAVETGARIGQIDLTDPANGGDSGIDYLTRTPGGLFGFALHGEDGRVSIFDMRSLEPVEQVRLPGPARRAFPTVNSQYLLVPNQTDRTLSMISTWTYGESLRLLGGDDVSGVNTAMFDTVAFLFRREDKKAIVLDLIEGRAIAELSLPGTPQTAVTVDAGRKIYLALSGSDGLAVIDAKEGRIEKIITGVGARPWAVSSAGTLSYCH